MAEVKLYVFASPEEARIFDHIGELRQAVARELSAHNFEATTADIESEAKPRRKKRKVAKEAFKERILEKARAKKQATAKVVEHENFDSHDEE